jgi:Tol biopolymer transport system component
VTIPAGTRLGHYEIVSAIGAGGMGQVYRARDTRLDRTVAVKVLPDSFASNTQLRARFEREAKVISSLSHPNICTLHDVGSQDGIDFLVMEHLEGDTLADRIARGPMPLEDVFRYAIEIAEALGRAHRAGVIHRDLKPANIMITRSGAKLLDFGLAKMTRQSQDEATAAFDTARKNADLTSEGTVLGTYPYMAPEQLEGEEADARSDLFAFGAVLYEMLTGKRAFSGKSRASVIASILAAEPPPIATLRPVTPAGLERLVQTCMRKDPDERWQSAHDVKLELELLRATGPAATQRLRAPQRWIPWGLAGLFALGMVATFLTRGRALPARSPIVASLSEAGMRFNVVDGPAVIAPDGRSFVVRGARDGGKDALYIRRLDSPTFTLLQGTEGAFDPFWSSDGQNIAFFIDSKLLRIPATGGPIATIAETTSDPRGGSWAGNTILFSPAANKPICRVAATGGTPVPVGPLRADRGELGQWRPTFLPDGHHYLYRSVSENQPKSGVYLADLEPEAPSKLLIDAATTAIYAESGHLLYAYGGDLYAQPFNLKTLEKNGGPLLVLKNVEYSDAYGAPAYSVAKDGSLVAQTWEGSARLTIYAVATNGAITPTDLDGSNIDLSPDGSRLAVQRVDTASRAPDIWIMDVRRGTKVRLTSDPAPEIGPVWAPDKSRIAYVAQLASSQSVRVQSIVGSDGPQEITRSTIPLEITDWSPDGRYLIAEVFDVHTATDLYIIDLQGKRTLEPLLRTRFSESSSRFSPDGHFVSYESNVGGQNDVYVQTFPAADQHWQVSVSGGRSARWSHDGRKLIFITPEGRLATVPFDRARGSEMGAPQVVGASMSQDITEPTVDGTLYMTAQRNTTDAILYMSDWTKTLLPQQADRTP